MTENERIGKGIITSKRRVINLGGSKAVTLPRTWLAIQKWLGKEVTELISLANEAIVLVPLGQEEKARKILMEFEKHRKEEVAGDE